VKKADGRERARQLWQKASSRLFPLDSPIVDEAQRQRLVVRWAGLVLLSMLSIWVVINTFLVAWVMILWHLVIIAGCLVILGLMNLGLPALVGAHLFCLMMLFTLLVSGYYSGGLTPAVLSLFAVAPVAAVTAAGLSGIFWIVPTVALVSFFFIQHQQGVDFPFLTAPAQQPLDLALTWLTAAATITLLIYYYEASRKRLEAELVKALAETEHVSEQRSRLLHLFGHEIRTPLHGILGLLGLMKDESNPAVRKALGKQAREAGNLLLKTVSEVLEISREGSGDERVFAPFIKKLTTPTSLPLAQVTPGGAKTVMIVEDDAVSQMLASTLLEKMGYQTCNVADGNQAVDVFRRGRFGLVLMDCQLPGRDGLEITRLIREFERDSGRPPVPIVAVSAQASVEQKRACLEAGMNDFLSKPFGREELESLVKRWLG